MKLNQECYMEDERKISHNKNNKPSNLYPSDQRVDKQKIINQNNADHISAISHFYSGDLVAAESKIVKVLRPIYSNFNPYKSTITIDQMQSIVLDSMYHLGLIYMHSNKYYNNNVKAAAIFQYCANFVTHYSPAKLSDGNLGTYEYFIEKAHSVEAKFLSSIGKLYEDIADHVIINSVQKSVLFKEELSSFRSKISNLYESYSYYSSKDSKTKKIQEIYKRCSSFFIDSIDQSSGLVNKLIVESMKQLGDPPEGCQYSIIGLGSLALGTITPWSDLEFAVLITDSDNHGREEEYREYFRNLTKLLWLKVVNIGETPLTTVGVDSLNNYSTGNEEDNWFQDDIVNKAFRFDPVCKDSCKSALGRHGSYMFKKKAKDAISGVEKEEQLIKPAYELIRTPEEMMIFQTTVLDELPEEVRRQSLYQNIDGWFYMEQYLVQALQTVVHIHGDIEPLKTYKSKLKKFQNDNSDLTKKRSLQLLQEDISKFALHLDSKEEGKFLNVKKTIYRIVERFVSALYNYTQIDDGSESPTSLWQMIDYMEKSKFLCSKGAKNLAEAMSIAAELRLSTYSYNDGRYDNISIYSPIVSAGSPELLKKLVINKTFYIGNTQILHRFYYIMLEVQNLIFANYHLNHCANINCTLSKNIFFTDNKFLKALVHARFCEYSLAIKYMEEARQDSPNELPILYNLINLYGKVGYLTKALEVTNHALKVAKNNVLDLILYYKILGQIYFYQENFKKSHECYTKLQSLIIQKETKSFADKMELANVYDNISTIFCVQKQFKAALLFSEWSLKIKLKHCQEKSEIYRIFEGYTKLAILHLCNKEEQLAQNYYDLSLKIIPSLIDNVSNVSGYVNLAILSHLHKDYDQEMFYYEEALRIRLLAYKDNPNDITNAYIYDKLGDVLLAKQEYEAAEQYFEISLFVKDSIYRDTFDHIQEANTYYKLAKVCFLTGRFQDGIEYQLTAASIKRQADCKNGCFNSIDLSSGNLWSISLDQIFDQQNNTTNKYNENLIVDILASDDRSIQEIVSDAGFDELFKNEYNDVLGLISVGA